MPATEPSVKEPAEEKVNILLVDDRPDKLLSMQVMLDTLNQNLVSARSGAEALRSLLHQDFAVILLDVNMPGMDGFETAALIRQRSRSEHTPIIFISAVNDTETHVSRGYSLGAVDYILTPVVPEILRAKIAVFVDLFKKTEQVKRQAENRAEFIREQARRAEAEAARERFAFLAEASNVLAGSLEHHEIFQNLARLIVPKLADYCVIDMLEEAGSLRQAAVAHRDPLWEPQLRTLREKCPVDLTLPHGVGHVFRTGKSELCVEANEEFLRGLSCNDEHFNLMKQLGFACSIIVPLIGRSGTLGAISLVSTSGERIYTASDLSLAEAFAQRAGLALDNAGLYKAAHKARTEAERANRAKDQFLAMLSHELRTPLTPVLTTVLALETDEQTPEAIRDSLQMIHRNVELEARLIDDLLDLTRISKGKVPLSLENVDAHTLLRNALDICEPDTREKKLALRENFSATRFHLRADPARLQQMFWNLIKNAVKFTPEGGQLSVTTRDGSDGKHLAVDVADTGMGIEPEFLPKIFDAFEQGERMRHGGLGLGLAITKTLVDLHGGSISAESAGPEQGSKFTLCLPTTSEIPSSAPSQRTRAWAPNKQNIRILLVEDHEDTNRSLTQLLRRRGYQIQSASDVRSAVELAAKDEFDVLISDMGLPDGSGLDVIEKIANAQHPIFGIALTGFGMESDIRKSHAAGFHHHLIKPVDLNKLDAIIQQVVMQAPGA
jgi:signal transduction histidine kinase/response regulator RpfG family c-di-GMP phosphodiesterase